MKSSELAAEVLVLRAANAKQKLELQKLNKAVSRRNRRIERLKLEVCYEKNPGTRPKSVLQRLHERKAKLASCSDPASLGHFENNAERLIIANKDRTDFDDGDPHS